MRLFYCCYGSAHSSVTAANIHLGHLPGNRRATLGEILHQPLFDRAADYEVGIPREMGTDERGNEILVLGLAGGRQAMVQALTDFLTALGIQRSQAIFCDALQHAGVLMRIGGYCSRRLGWVWLGRPLCAGGVFKYPRFVHHVRQVRELCRPG